MNTNERASAAITSIDDLRRRLLSLEPVSIHEASSTDLAWLDWAEDAIALLESLLAANGSDGVAS